MTKVPNNTDPARAKLSLPANGEIMMSPFSLCGDRAARAGYRGVGVGVGVGVGGLGLALVPFNAPLLSKFKQFCFDVVPVICWHATPLGRNPVSLHVRRRHRCHGLTVILRPFWTRRVFHDWIADFCYRRFTSKPTRRAIFLIS
ncbi:uncharacterized protein ARMOST_18081 [Armillaria ostoyae]|uniref:Uncharacterized protein n=1 Tax=Armillaria ostoyae TaxID=47428 RepID=A0A284S0S7_ARMOS|nr:uncharacterized protein ARMOST_18081 [Armillaria ostoyae]